MPKRPPARSLSRNTSGLIAPIAALLLTSGLAWAPRAEAMAIVSYQVEGGLPASQTIGGTLVRPSDAVDVGTNALVFDAFGTNPLAEDLDALHVLANGDIIFSTDTDVTQAFPGLPNGFKNGDLVLWDGSTGSIFFSESNFTSGGNPNISAFYLFESGPNAGKLLLGTKGADDVLGGMAFEWGNLLLYDTGSDTSSLFFDQDLITGTLTQKNVDAVHVQSDGTLLLSISIDNGSLGGLTLQDQDLVAYDPNALTASLFLGGNGLFDGTTRDIDAVSIPIPEPGTLLLMGLGMLGLAGTARQRRRRRGSSHAFAGSVGLVSAAIMLIGAGSADASTIVSYQRPPDLETLGGTAVSAPDLVDVDSSALVFDAFGTNPTFEDVDAAHLLSDGRVLFSTVTAATIVRSGRSGPLRPECARDAASQLVPRR